MSELPFETWERLFREPWPGGRSLRVQALLTAYGIYGTLYPPGSAEANTALQECLIRDHSPVDGEGE